MASINKKIGKQGWIIQIRNFGLGTMLRTTIKSKTEANVKLREINTRIDELTKDKTHEFWSWAIGDRREYVKHGIKPVIQEEEQAPLSLVDAKAMFLQRNKGAVTTRESYDRYLSRFVDFMTQEEIFAMESVTSKDVQDFLDDYMTTPIKTGANVGEFPKPVSQQKYIDHAKMMWKHHEGYGVPNVSTNVFAPVETGMLASSRLDDLIEWDDFAKRTEHLDKLGVPLLTRGAYRKIIFTKDQLQELRSYLQSKLWDSERSTLEQKQLFAALMLCMFTGIRRSEIARIRKQDVNIEYEEITVLRMKGRGKKEFNRLRVTVHPIAMRLIVQLIELLPADQQSVFSGDDDHLNGESFHELKTRSKAESLGKRYKTSLKGSEWENVHGFHKFRHSLAAALMAEGATKEQVKEAIGWSDDKMYDRYIHMASSRQRSLIETAFPSQEPVEYA